MKSETTLQRWERLCRELTHPAVELTVEEFALLLSTYKRLLAGGHRFDIGTLALMTVLARQLVRSDEAVDDFDDEQDMDEAAAVSYPLTTATSDECLADDIEQQRVLRTWSRPAA